MSRGKHFNVAIFVPHVGCPRQCSFCNQHTITGDAGQPAPEDVKESAYTAFRSLGDRVRQAEIAFFGGSFTAIDKGYMESLLQAAQECVKLYGFTGIRVSTRPDAVEMPVLRLLQAYGVTAVELGAQSMDDRVLALNSRGHTAAQTLEGAKRVKGMGFSFGLQMMTGLYGDTDQAALETADKLIALQPDTIRIYPTVVLPGTGLEDLYRQGAYRPQTLEEAVALCARLLPRFEEAGVRVIRMGLHAEQEVEAQAIAGPYHPAFRQLVESQIFLQRLERELSKRGPGAYEVSVKPNCLSTAQGQRKENLDRLLQAGFRVRLLQDEDVPEKGFVIKQEPEFVKKDGNG